MVRQLIAGMPGFFQFSLAEIANEAQRSYDLGLQAVLLFGIPKKRRPDNRRLREKRHRAPGGPLDQGPLLRAGRNHGCLSMRMHEPWPLRRHPHGWRTLPCVI